ncbi:hypothetical protein [Hymenobacter yonginensis]|uniref:Uncharacterized protein n=1 Tax=Hymenobacter yonginensis TaxID=748197 RepID=A0ABY7PW04_9BACT|nr:hypothetical protein [Hymenobacter yonginensis]WBO86704.1 hypothetical protein O9Z63_20705 [Hymenobacter yonginensis]
MIDRSTGDLIFALSVRVCVGDQLETVASLALGEGHQVQEMGTGWTWLRAQNVHKESQYFSVGFAFYNNRLRQVHLVFSPTRLELSSSWDTWSESAERQRLGEYKQWVRDELGHEGRFPWGTVEVVYDAKGGSSGISLRYE